MRPPLVLASQSPRRRELLGILGPLFTVVPAEIVEVPRAGEKPEQFLFLLRRQCLGSRFKLE